MMDVDVDPQLQRLVAAHAPLFRGAHPEVPSDLAPGWYPLVDGLCSDIEAVLGDACAMFQVLQIKEKFGGLRVYYRLQCASDFPAGVGARVRDLVQQAEADSKGLCEQCGAPAKLRNREGWLVTLCEPHLAEWAADDGIQRQDVGLQGDAVPQPAVRGGHVLYLDFDGVLHPHDVDVEPRRGPYVNSPEGHAIFEHAELLSDLLEPYPHVRIVLSTGWVTRYRYSGAQRRLPPRLFARCVGATWHREMPLPAFEALSRGEQVRADVARRQPQAWLALDDHDEGWEDARGHSVVITDPIHGISSPAVLELLKVSLQRFALPFGPDVLGNCHSSERVGKRLKVHIHDDEAPELQVRSATSRRGKG